MNETRKRLWQRVLVGGMLIWRVPLCHAQLGAGGGFGNAGNSIYREDSADNSPSATERNKRRGSYGNYGYDQRDANMTYLEASVLMNVKADEYVAVFAVRVEGATALEADTKMSGTLDQFKKGIRALGVKDKDLFVDTVAQARIYRYEFDQEKYIADEQLAGFELKKNVSIHFVDKSLIDALLSAAARADIYDLVKVDYVVRDAQAIKDRLSAEAMRILKAKAARYETQLGLKLYGPLQVVVDSPSVYNPIEQYHSYVAAEAESLVTPSDRYTIRKLRRTRTFFFDPLNGNNFDLVINPIIIEPVVQFTAYMRVRYSNTPPQADGLPQTTAPKT